MSCESCKKYRKRPVVIEALQYCGYNFSEVEKFCRNNGASKSCAEMRQVRDGVYACFITTLEGEHCASDGDFIIKGVHGEFYPCKPDIFAKTYEALDSIPEPVEDERTCGNCALDSLPVEPYDCTECFKHSNWKPQTERKDI